MAASTFEVIIIGGSYAGLSAAMALGRSRRRVLIIDSGISCNRQTPHSHNFLTRDGEKPAAIASIARQEVLKYDTVQFQEDLAEGVQKTAEGFMVRTASGKAFNAKKLVFATGISDMMPAIKGFADCWGISVVHCPYCHGYELKELKTGILANGARAVHLASLVSNLTKDVTIFTMGTAEFTESELNKFAKHNIQLVETVITSVQHENGHLHHLGLADGSSLAFDALYAALPFTQHSAIPQSLGCEITAQGYIAIDDFQKTSLQDIYACGDNSSMMRSVAKAVYNGNLAGAMLNKELTDESF